MSFLAWSRLRDALFPNYEFDGNAEDYLGNWGLTIYRTDYSSHSDDKWESLLNLIRTEMRASILRYDRDEPCAEAYDYADRFQLDPRSDPQSLDGSSIDELRQKFKDNVGGEPMGATLQTHDKSFLLADAEVFLTFDGSAQAWVKSVMVDYDTEWWRASKNKFRFGPQRFFGWMRVRVQDLFLLWDDLMNRGFQSAAPPMTPEGDAKVWKQ